jgi:protein involved in polysaccharide export with SLBB domain
LPTDFEANQRARYTSPDLLESVVDPNVYVLGPGDLLAVMLVVGETRSEQLPVLPEGVVLVPHIGPVPAAGKTLSAFREALRGAVAKRYRDFELHCYLVRQRQFRVYVTGEVKAPGFIAARATERVSDVVERAGGFSDLGSRREIELRDAEGKRVGRVDLARFLGTGDIDANPVVSAGQVVMVPARGRVASVQGEVRAPGNVEVREGDTVLDLLLLAGGPTAVADLANVAVEHTDSSGKVWIETCDLRAQSPPASDVTRATVFSHQFGQRRVFFIAPDDRQQTFYVGDDETLAGLVRRVGALPPDANLGGGQLATRDSNGVAIQVPVDLRSVMAGEQDRALQDGDVLSVPSVKGYVYVSGHVTRPGRYAYRAEWTVNDYLGEAGGPAPSGTRDRVTLLASDGKQRDGDRRTPVRRGETVYVDRSVGSKAGVLLGTLISLSALAISVVALTK